MIKFTKDGEKLWQREVITYSSTEVFSVAANESHVYVAGRSEDKVAINGVRNPPASFVKKYDHDGNLIWTYIDDQIARNSFGITLDEDGLYARGSTLGIDPQGVISRINFDGNRVWSKKLGSGTRIVNAIAVDKDRLYAASSTRDGRIFIYNTDGDYLDEFAVDVSPNLSGVSMSLYAGHLYISGSDIGIGDLVLKVDLVGNHLWKDYFFEANGRTGGIAVTDKGVFVGGRISNSHSQSDKQEDGMRLVQYHFDGSIKQVWAYPQLGMFPDSVIVESDQIFFGGFVSGQPSSKGFVARFSEINLLPPSIVAVGDVNDNRYQDVAILENNYGAGSVRALIKDSSSSDAFINQVDFDDDLKPIDFKVLADINGNGLPELVVLGIGDSRAQIRDSLSGDVLNTIAFNSNLDAVSLAIMPDMNMNGADELAVLAKHPSLDWVQVEIRDSTSGALLTTVPFNPAFIPVQLIIVADMNGDGTPELGVLANSKIINHPDKVEIRNLEAELIGNIWIGFPPFDSRQAMSYTNENGEKMMAILQSNISNNSMRVARANMDTLKLAGFAGFNGNFTAVKMAVLKDNNGNDFKEFAVFGKNHKNGRVHTQIRDSNTGDLLKNIWLWKEYLAHDLTTLPSLNSNDSDELLMLVRQQNLKNLRTFVKDSQDDTLINIID